MHETVLEDTALDQDEQKTDPDITSDDETLNVHESQPETDLTEPSDDTVTMTDESDSEMEIEEPEHSLIADPAGRNRFNGSD